MLQGWVYKAKDVRRTANNPVASLPSESVLAALVALEPLAGSVVEGGVGGSFSVGSEMVPFGDGPAPAAPHVGGGGHMHLPELISPGTGDWLVALTAVPLGEGEAPEAPSAGGELDAPLASGAGRPLPPGAAASPVGLGEVGAASPVGLGEVAAPEETAGASLSGESPPPAPAPPGAGGGGGPAAGEEASPAGAGAPEASGPAGGAAGLPDE